MKIFEGMRVGERRGQEGNKDGMQEQYVIFSPPSA
jgi:hypothetical protein